MSQEGCDVDALASCSTSGCKISNNDEFSRLVLQRIDDDMHRTLDALDGSSNQNLRSLIAPAHLPILLGTILKVRACRLCFHVFHIS
jgi:hypothetical protein